MQRFKSYCFPVKLATYKCCNLVKHMPGSVKLTQNLRRDLVVVLRLDQLSQSRLVLCADLMLIPARYVDNALMAFKRSLPGVLIF